MPAARCGKSLNEDEAVHRSAGTGSQSKASYSSQAASKIYFAALAGFAATAGAGISSCSLR